jgi:hypothetical protein
MGPLTQQFFFSSSDVIATTCFDHTIIIIQLTAIAVKQTACDSAPLSAA